MAVGLQKGVGSERVEKLQRKHSSVSVVSIEQDNNAPVSTHLSSLPRRRQGNGVCGSRCEAVWAEVSLEWMTVHPASQGLLWTHLGLLPPPPTSG